MIYFITKKECDHLGRYKKGVWSLKHQKILELDVKKGLSLRDTAAKLGYRAHHTIEVVRNSDEYTRRRAELVEIVVTSAQNTMRDNSLSAALQIVDLMKHGQPKHRIRLEAALQVLNYAGIKPREITEVIERKYTPEEVNSTLKTTKEIEAITHRISVRGSSFVITKIPSKRVVETTPSNTRLDTSTLEVEEEESGGTRETPESATSSAR